MSVETVINQALDLIGYKRHIGSVYDGSPAARIALNAFAETRDEVLALQAWDFARMFLNLVADPTPAPPFPWGYRFTRPDAVITVLDVFPGNLSSSALLSPTPTRWLEVTAPDRNILTNFTPAMAVVTSSITDITVWTPEFTLAVIRALAEKFEHALVGKMKDKSDDAGRRDQQRS